MSKLTNLLKLFKWNTEDENDLKSEFDIDKSMNDNWDKLDDFAGKVDSAVIEIQDDIESIQKVDKKQDELIQKLKDNSINITTEEATQLHIEDASELSAVLDVRGNHYQNKILGVQILQDTNQGTTGWNFQTHPQNLGVLEEVSYLGTRACKFSLIENPSNWKFISRKIDLTKLKNNTKYTLQLDVKTNYSETLHLYVQNSSSQNKVIDFGAFSVNGEKQIKLVGTSNDATISDQILYIIPDNIGNDSGRELIMTNAILVEGDYSNKDLKHENYTNLEGSPSLDYPSEVEAIGDNINILPNEAESKSGNGIEWTVNEDGSVKASGTATNNEGLYLIGNSSATEEVFRFKANKQYKNVSNVDILYRKTDGNYGRLQKNTVFSFLEDEVIGLVYLQIASGETVDETYYPKIVEYYEGIDESYSPYEQGSVEIIKNNKNMAKIDNINKTITSNGITVTINDEGVVTLNGTATANFYINLYDLTASANDGYRLPKGNYKAFFELLEKNNSQISESNGDIHFYYRNRATSIEGTPSVSYADFVKIIQMNEEAFVKEMEITEDTIVSYVYVSSGVVLDNLKFRFAIFNEKETNTTYIKHEESNYTLPIQEEMLKGDYFDLNKGKEVHHFKSYVTKSTDNWILTIDSVNRFRFDNSNISNTSLNNKNQYCSHSKLCYDWATQYESFQARRGSFYFRTKRFSTAEEFNQFVAEQEEAGTPLTFWYECEPYELDLTKEQKEVLHQLQELGLFKGTNNIITAESLALLQMIYIADTKNYIDKEIENKVNEKLSNIQVQLLDLKTGGN